MTTFNEIIEQAAIDAVCTPRQARAAIQAALANFGKATVGDDEWFMTGVGMLAVVHRSPRRYRQPANGTYHTSTGKFSLHLFRPPGVRIRQRDIGL